MSRLSSLVITKSRMVVMIRLCLVVMTRLRLVVMIRCNELVFKSIGHYSSTPEHRTRCSTCSACSAVCSRFNQGTIDLCFLSVSLATRLP